MGVIERIGHDLAERRTSEQGSRTSRDGDCHVSVELVGEESRCDYRVVKRVGRVDVNVSAGKGHQRPEDRGEYGWIAFAYKLGHWHFLELLVRTCIGHICV